MYKLNKIFILTLTGFFIFSCWPFGQKKPVSNRNDYFGVDEVFEEEVLEEAEGEKLEIGEEEKVEVAQVVKEEDAGEITPGEIIKIEEIFEEDADELEEREKVGRGEAEEKVEEYIEEIFEEEAVKVEEVEVEIEEEPKKAEEIKRGAEVVEVEEKPKEVVPEIEMGEEFFVPIKEAKPGPPVMFKKPPVSPELEWASILNVDFQKGARKCMVIINTSMPLEYDTYTISDTAVVIDMKGVEIPKNLERSLDVSEFDSVVNMISSYQQSRLPEKIVRVVITLDEMVPYDVQPEENIFIIKFQEPSRRIVKEGKVFIEDEGGFFKEVDITREARGEEIGYTGPRISLDFKEVDIDNVLRILSDITGFSVIADEDVTGTITLKLINVPADQAFDIILETKSLGKVEIGDNIFRVAPKERLQQEMDREVQARKKAVEAEPLYTKIISVSFANAGEFLPVINESVLSTRGKIQVDVRSNTLIIRDIEKSVNEAIALIRRLDVQTPQVMIQARIVEASVSFSRKWGINWGGSFSADQSRGYDMQTLKYINVGGPGVTGLPNDNFIVDFIETDALLDQGGALGLTMSTIANILTLDLILAALETSGEGRIISSPRVTTVDNKEASIMDGSSIPYMSVGAGGAGGTSVAFADAVLSITVTPHITSSGSVIMQLNIKKDEPDWKNVVMGVPALKKKEAKTEVLINDGETVVIGGIYTRDVSSYEGGVPFLSSIPVLGRLFKTTSREDSKKELLVFVTPRIIDRKAIIPVETISKITQEDEKKLGW